MQLFVLDVTQVQMPFYTFSKYLAALHLYLANFRLQRVLLVTRRPDVAPAAGCSGAEPPTPTSRAERL